MSQVLVLSGNRKVDVDRMFVDAGKPPVFTLMGGARVLVEQGTPPKPMIYQRGKDFFTMDEKPMSEDAAKPWLEDGDWEKVIGEPFRAFLSRVASGKPIREKPGKLRKQRKPTNWKDRPVVSLNPTAPS